jgi:hypothetical protein
LLYSRKPVILRFQGGNLMQKDVFGGMEGLTLEAMKAMVSAGRHWGKLELHRHGDRWVMLFRPPGQQDRTRFYLMGEKSRRPRLFASADTALGIVATMKIPGVWVSPFQMPGKLVL